MSDLINLLKGLDAVIFDMDGTMVNTEPLHAKAAIVVLNDLGLNVNFDTWIDQFYGMTDTDVLKMSCPNLSEAEIDKAIAEKNVNLIKLFNQLSPSEKNQYITPGLFDFLQMLRRQNKKLAVVSASEDIIVSETLKCFDIHSFLDLQMGRNQTNLTKPHPEPYLEGMKRLQTIPEKTLIFEDSPTGLQSALASGANVIRITGFAHSDKVLHSKERKNFIF